MTTQELRRIMRTYYRAQGGIRPKPRAVAHHPVPGVAFDITVITVFIVLGLACMF